MPSEEDEEKARRFFIKPPELSSNPVIRVLQRRSQWGDPANLTSNEEAEIWIRYRAMHGDRKPWELKLDYRVTPQSLPFLLNIVSSEELPMTFMATFVLKLNGAAIRHDETESTDATLCWITLPDGSEHERPINLRSD